MTRYTVRYCGKDIWDRYFSDESYFDTEADARTFIEELTSNPHRVMTQIFLVTTEVIL